MKIAYSHNNGQVGVKGTICVGLPTKEQLQNMFTNGEKIIQLPIGAAFLHKKDNFVKKIGRNTSLSKTNTRTFELNDIKIHEDGKIIFDFITTSMDFRPNSSEDIQITVGMSIYKDNPNVHLLYAFFNE